MARGALTPKREKFAQGVASGLSQADAYRAAFNVGNSTAKTIQESASRLVADSKVAARVAELRAPIAERAQITLESHLEDLKRLRNMAARDKFRPGKCKHLRMTVDDEFVACDAAWG